MSDGRVPRGQEAISLVGERRTGQDVTEWSRKPRVHDKKIEESGWRLHAVAGGSGGRWIVRSASEGPENAELGQEWLGGHCEVTAKSEEPHVFRRVPTFQTSGNVVQVREQRLVMRVTIDQGRRTGQDGVVRLIN